jgi:hypothetical protein
MRLDLPSSAHTSIDPTPTLSAPSEVIDRMIELRVQLFELDQQIQALQPAFFATCLSLNTDKIQHGHEVCT